MLFDYATIQDSKLRGKLYVDRKGNYYGPKTSTEGKTVVVVNVPESFAKLTSDQIQMKDDNEKKDHMQEQQNIEEINNSSERENMLREFENKIENKMKLILGNEDCVLADKVLKEFINKCLEQEDLKSIDKEDLKETLSYVLNVFDKLNRLELMTLVEITKIALDNLKNGDDESFEMVDQFLNHFGEKEEDAK